MSKDRKLCRDVVVEVVIVVTVVVTVHTVRALPLATITLMQETVGMKPISKWLGKLKPAADWHPGASGAKGARVASGSLALDAFHVPPMAPNAISRQAAAAQYQPARLRRAGSGWAFACGRRLSRLAHK